MDPKEIQAKVQDFAQRLLDRADGDPVRALGLLVLVLDGWEHEGSEQYTQFLQEVRKVLMPIPGGERELFPIQHLAGDLSWEGYQHCLRCGKVLGRGAPTQGKGIPTGYVYQQNGEVSSIVPDTYESCEP